MYRFFLEIPLKIYNYTAFQLKFYKFYPFHFILTTLQQSSRQTFVEQKKPQATEPLK